MNLVVTSKEAILDVSKGIVAKKGIRSLNMRVVAKECHIALGTLYNYFEDKNELVLATVESIWKDIFHGNQEERGMLSFCDYVEELYTHIQRGAQTYPGFLMAHFVSIASAEREQAKQMMASTFNHMRNGMLEVLENDSEISADAFSDALSKEDFVGFILDYLLTLLLQNQTHCHALLEIIGRVIYK